MRPESFDDAYRLDWALWVLDYDLPVMPIELVEGQHVPVARWAGPQFGAVLMVGTCPHDPDCDPGAHFVTDMLRYRRNGDTWERAVSSGGTDWHSTTLGPPDVPPGYVEFSDSHRGVVTPGGWDCLAAAGLVGTAATWIEVTERGTVSRRPIEAPAGAFVVACDRAASIAVLDADGTELGRKTWT